MFGKRSKSYSILRLKCPRCHEGKMFLNPNPYNLKDVTKMHDACPVCNQDYVIEPGFYFGAAYVSYAINIALLISSFVVLFFVLKVDGYWLYGGIVGIVVVLAPIIFRISRAGWINIFVHYQKEEERGKKKEETGNRSRGSE